MWMPGAAARVAPSSFQSTDRVSSQWYRSKSQAALPPCLAERLSLSGVGFGAHSSVEAAPQPERLSLAEKREIRLGTPGKAQPFRKTQRRSRAFSSIEMQKPRGPATRAAPTRFRSVFRALLDTCTRLLSGTRRCFRDPPGIHPLAISSAPPGLPRPPAK